MNISSTIAFVVPTLGEFAPYREILADLRSLDESRPWEVYEGRAGVRRVVFIISGAGPVNAAAATEHVIGRYQPTAVLHGGSAGAHNPELLPGDVVLGDRYLILTPRTVRAARIARGLHPSLIRFRRDGESVRFDHLDAAPDLLARAMRLANEQITRLGAWPAAGWPAHVPARRGRIVTGAIGSADAWTVDATELQALHADVGTECEDMESAYVAQVCAVHRRPFLAVRAISNNEAACALAPAEVAAALAAAGERAAVILAALAAEL